MNTALKNIIVLGFLFLSFTISAQEFGFNIHNTSLDKYLEMEQKLKSERIPTTSNHISLNGDAQPIEYKRKEKDIPDLMVYYFFKEKDSTMSYVLYEWDVYNFDQKENNKKPKKFQKALIEKYSTLEKMITELYGKATIEGSLSDLNQIDKKGGLKKGNTWNPNDSTEIEMYTAISNFYEKQGMVTRNPTHRIRLYVKNTKKEQKSNTELDEKTLTTLKIIANEFLQVLGKKDISKSKEYLSDKIRETVTDEQITSLIENLNFERETELIYSGIQLGPDGSVFTMLQYKYRDDSFTPPNELIKIIFDNKNKIIGIQPIKLQAK